MEGLSLLGGASVVSPYRHEQVFDLGAIRSKHNGTSPLTEPYICALCRVDIAPVGAVGLGGERLVVGQIPRFSRRHLPRSGDQEER